MKSENCQLGQNLDRRAATTPVPKDEALIRIKSWSGKRSTSFWRNEIL